MWYSPGSSEIQSNDDFSIRGRELWVVLSLCMETPMLFRTYWCFLQSSLSQEKSLIRGSSIFLGVKLWKYRLFNGLKEAYNSSPAATTIISKVDVYQSKKPRRMCTHWRNQFASSGKRKCYKNLLKSSIFSLENITIKRMRISDRGKKSHMSCVSHWKMDEFVKG